jgi:hypothetical protein
MDCAAWVRVKSINFHKENKKSEYMVTLEFSSGALYSVRLTLQPARRLGTQYPNSPALPRLESSRRAACVLQVSPWIAYWVQQRQHYI